jgi:alpha-1,2-mannosyltransferase
MQLDITAKLLSQYPSRVGSVKLVLLGSVRNTDDAKIVSDLENQIKNLGLRESVEIIANAPYKVLLSYLQKSSIGLHTMRDEHFGISIIEYMAAGLIPVVHKSGGPLMDIVGPSNSGFMADTVDSFAQALEEFLSMSSVDTQALRSKAREYVKDRFSETTFSESFVKIIHA